MLTIDISCHLHDLRELHTLLRRRLKILDRENLQPTLIDQLRRQFHIGPLQPRHNRCPQVHTLYHANQSLRNSITSDNSAEDVHEDGCDFGIAGDEVESLLDCLGRGASTNVEEVGWGAPVQLDDVHCGHCKAGAID